MTMLRPISHTDIERLFDRLANDTVDEALRERLKCQGQFIKGGGLQASRYPITVDDTTRRILRKGISASMQLLTNIVARNDTPYEHTKALALNRITNMAHQLANLVDEANRQMPTLDMNKVRAEYLTIVNDGISDFEVGMIDGKPAKPSQNLIFNVGGDIFGNVQIAGDGAHQAISQAKVEQHIDLLALADELGKLRVALRRLDTDASQDIAIGKIAEAEIAAKSQDGERSRTSLAEIGKGAADWMLGTAKEIGTKILVEYLEKKYGL